MESGSKEPGKYGEVRDWSLLVSYVIKDITEATRMLSPLKSTMALVIRGRRC
jgi:hypothetical protein